MSEEQTEAVPVVTADPRAGLSPDPQPAGPVGSVPGGNGDYRPTSAPEPTALDRLIRSRRQELAEEDARRAAAQAELDREHLEELMERLHSHIGWDVVGELDVTLDWPRGLIVAPKAGGKPVACHLIGTMGFVTGGVRFGVLADALIAAVGK